MELKAGDEVLVRAKVTTLQHNEPDAQGMIIVSIDNDYDSQGVYVAPSQFIPLGRKVWVARDNIISAHQVLDVYNSKPVYRSERYWEHGGCGQIAQFDFDEFIAVHGPEHLPAPGECKAFYMPLIAVEGE